ncbi:MAG: nuclear transport factor 2 family protein [Deltaproteobacteria bacterium]|nr:nuclear transport factor 2 family protein [Deltaproteobacteria bacterium]
MIKLSLKLLLRGVIVIGFAACTGSTAEIAKEMVDAINTKNSEAATALLAPEAMSALTPVVEELIAQNSKLELVGDYTVKSRHANAQYKVTNDELIKLGITAVEATLETVVINKKLTDFRLVYTAETQAKITEAELKDTIKIIDDFENAINEKNIDAALALLSPEAKIISLDNTQLSNQEEIKAYLTQLAAQNFKIEKAEKKIEDDKFVWQSKVQTADWTKAKLEPLDVTGQATIIDSKIISYGIALTEEALNKLQQAAAAAQATEAKDSKKSKKH